MMSYKNENKRIVRNTALLYLRSIAIMAISIFTSRIILQCLGVEDFGLYGVIGTTVTIFTFLNGILSISTSRFITFDLGKGDKEALRKTFSASFGMHFAMAIFVLLLLETIGLWLLNNKINIPEGREYAANVCYHLSVATCVLSITQIPYSAIIIAYERMNLFAYIGIVEAVFKLVLPLSLLYFNFSDNLIAYGIIIALWSICLQIFYRIYCLRNFPETHLHIEKNIEVYKNMLSYSMWDFLGQICASVNGQGTSILVNMFFGVRMNASQSVSSQVEGKVSTFVGNFMTAVAPQIVKSFAQGDKQRFLQLIREAGRFSFFLFLILAMPFFFECEYILDLWLVEVPEYATIFIRFTLAISLFRTIARPVINGVHATGDVKFMNLSAALIAVITTLPGTYLLFKLGFPFWSFLILIGIISITSSFFEIIALYRKIRFNIWGYLRDVYGNVFLVTAISSTLPSLCIYYLTPSAIRFVLVCAICLLSTGFSIFFIGLNKPMQRKVWERTTNTIKDFFHRQS